MTTNIKPQYDALIIGCGPGGSSVATFLAKAGKRVLVLEKEMFPRFHIGESLLPCNMTIFRDMGVLPALQAAGFPRKFGAQFELGNGSIGTRFVFRQGRFNREPEAIQVERATFDHVLLKHARASGADVREGWTVAKFEADEHGVTVMAHDPDGKPHEFRASYLVDASGRGNLTGNQDDGAINLDQQFNFNNGTSSGLPDITIPGYTGPVEVIGFDQVSVPEPSTWTMMLFGIGAMGLMMRKHRKPATV